LLATHGDRVVLALQLGYLVAVSGWFIARQVYPSFLLIFLLVASAFMWRARYRAFLVQLFPFMLLILSYRLLRSFADDFSLAELHITDLIAWERALFGGSIPAHLVQQALLDTPAAPVLTAMANTLYMSHFVNPVLLAVLIWHLRRDAYWGFMVGLVGMSYVGFLCYVLFPAAPPWWATHFGYLLDQPVTLRPSILGPDAMLAGPNPVAAMPSLHAAYAVFVAAYVVWLWGRRASPVLALPIGVGFATVYLGHHYVIDLVAGGGLALACFAVMVRGWRPGRAPAMRVTRPVLGSGIPAVFDRRRD
jgi:membrane-associated phospholipid phosphatase